MAYTSLDYFSTGLHTVAEYTRVQELRVLRVLRVTREALSLWPRTGLIKLEIDLLRVHN